MDEFESLSHSQWECKYHVVIIPKCRCRTLSKELRNTSARCSASSPGRERVGLRSEPLRLFRRLQLLRGSMVPLFLRKLVLGIPAQASGKNYAATIASGGPSRPASLVPTQPGVGTSFHNDWTPCRDAFVCSLRPLLPQRSTGTHSALGLLGTTRLRFALHGSQRGRPHARISGTNEQGSSSCPVHGFDRHASELSSSPTLRSCPGSSPRRPRSLPRRPR